MPVRKTDAPTGKQRTHLKSIAASGGHAVAARREAERDGVIDTMPQLRAPEDALSRLDMIARLALKGLVTGVAAGAAANATRTWLDGFRVHLSAARLKELERQLEELAAENTRLRGQLEARR
ncbi:MAG: hypothetical protein ACK5ZO_18120 [Gemmatimonas sp.]|jgi:hypothetical protein|uniref:hypothetical protein n=1 Tax=Gemmatimonas sp. TaxID=1962908 RepID=UPI00391F6902